MSSGKVRSSASHRAGADGPASNVVPSPPRRGCSGLKARGLAVVNLADLSALPLSRGRGSLEPPRRVAAPPRRRRRDTRALAEGFTIVLGGDCSLVGRRRRRVALLGQPLGLVYLDADADLNTPETTPPGGSAGWRPALGEGPREWSHRGPRLAPTLAGGLPAPRRGEAVGTWGCFPLAVRQLAPGPRRRWRWTVSRTVTSILVHGRRPHRSAEMPGRRTRPRSELSTEGFRPPDGPVSPG
jgi:hypothetical protein